MSDDLTIITYKNHYESTDEVEVALFIEEYSTDTSAESVDVAIPDQSRKFVKHGDVYILEGNKSLYIPMGFDVPNVTLEGIIFNTTEYENNILNFYHLLPDMLVEFDDLYWEVQNRKMTFDRGVNLDINLRKFELILLRQYYPEERDYVQD